MTAASPAAAGARARVLLAGIGNVFLGDDGFGVEVARRIDPSALPDDIDVAEYGIRGVHLAYDLLDDRYGSLVLIDALPLDDAPGTLAVIEVTEPTGSFRYMDAAVPAVDAHSMSPDVVLRVLHALGGDLARVVVVGCQPASFDHGMGLSPRVSTAVDEAAAMACEAATAEAERLRTRVRHPILAAGESHA